MENTSTNSPQERLKRLVYKSIYIAAFVFFALKIYQHHHYNYGYSLLPLFNHDFQERSIELLKETPHYTHEDGYDGQFYAQLALKPLARGTEIETALDNYTYRARRILFSWTAWCLGLGQPSWILQAYSFQNAIFWFLTAILLIRWLPPINAQNTFRYIACFFTLGLVNSFSRALLDGPSLFLIVMAAFLIETRRSWLGAATLGLAGLGKETNLIAVVTLLGPGKLRSNLNSQFILKAAIAILPFVLWFAYVLSSSQFGNSENIGTRNFTLPFVGAFETFLTIIKVAGDKGFPPGTFLTLATLGSLLVQGIYLLARPKKNSVWSRIGIVFAILMLVLGPAVWEGLQAVPRVLLPMTIAFNILFSRKLFLIPILVFANTLTFVGISSFEPKLIEERFEMVDESNLAYDPSTNEYSYLEFTNGWSINEGKKSRYWRWSQGDSVAEFFVPRNQSIEVELSFTPKTISPRDIILEVNGEHIWQAEKEQLDGDVYTIPLILNPGNNTLRFYSPTPPEKIGSDPRPLSFALVDYNFRLIRTIPESE